MPRAPRVFVAAVGLTVLIASGACRHPGAARLEGHWRGQRADGVGPEAQAAANAFAVQTEIDVHADVITVVTPHDRQTGKYRLVREDRTQVVLTTDKDGPDAEQTFTFADDRTMRWTVLEGKTITFVRD